MPQRYVYARDLPGSPTAAAFCIPIVLAACALGLWAGLGIAAFVSLAVWFVAAAGVAGWYTPLTTPDLSHLSFEAPSMTVIFVAVAGIVGGWGKSDKQGGAR